MCSARQIIPQNADDLAHLATLRHCFDERRKSEGELVSEFNLFVGSVQLFNSWLKVPTFSAISRKRAIGMDMVVVRIGTKRE